ncbi:MAG: hypothetical protein SOZ59_02475 [Candidatus Limivivens sp.]|nr:hypothetical protein [Candidatus Limivivens sp.]
MKLTWYEPLYVGPEAAKKKEKLIKKINQNAGLMDVYVITMAANHRDLFDILPTSCLKQPALYRNLPPVVGIACGREEAVGLVIQIVEETLQKTGGADVRSYLREHRRIKE